MGSERVQQAIQLLVKDTEGKFDEGTVDSLITELSRQTRSWLESHLQGTLIDLYQSPDFKNYNLTRILKFHQANPVDIPTAEALWPRLTQIIKENNPSHVAAALLILKCLTNDKEGYKWIMDVRFNRTIRLEHETKIIEIQDAVTISRYYMETSKNYHIQDYAKKLLYLLLKQSCKFRLHQLHRIVVSAKKVIQELLQLRLPGICQVIIQIVEDVYIHAQLMERYDIVTQARQCFFESIDSDARDIIPITKCYASLSSQSEIDPAVDALRKKKNYEAIIAFVTHIHEEILPRHHLMYIIYPILAKCDSEDAQVLMMNLFITREDQIFLDRHMQDKFTLTCISYIRKILKRQTWTSVWSTLSQQKFIYYLDVLTEYVKCNCISQKAYKNVMESCHVLRCVETSMKRRVREIGWLWSLTNNCIETIEKLNEKVKSLSESRVSSGENPNHFRAIIMELIQVISVSHRIASNHAVHPKNDQNIAKIIDLASKFDDTEIQNTFAEFFIANDVMQMGDAIPDRGEKYINLVWNQMYRDGLDKENHDLLGNAAELLISIDYKADGLILEKMGLRSHHDIPHAIGDLFIKYSTVPSIAEKIISCLHNPEVVKYPIVRFPSPSAFNYISFLDNGNLPNTVEPHLDHLVEGLCVTVKGESDSQTRNKAVKLINATIQDFMENHDDEEYLIKRLVKTKIIETLYEISAGSMFSMKLKELGAAKVESIRHTVVKNRTQLIIDFINMDNPDERRLQRAHQVAQFYSTQCKSLFRKNYAQKTTVSKLSNMSLNQYINDVIDEKISDRISECY